MQDNELNYKPPAEEIPSESEFGGYVQDGVYPVKCIEWRSNPNKPDNAWVEFVITDKQFAAEGKFSMNLYLPTKTALNERASRLVEAGTPKEELREKTLKGFFHYGQTLKAAGVAAGLTISEALDKLKGWEGKAIFENRPGRSTSVKKIVGAGESTRGAAPATQVQAF